MNKRIPSRIRSAHQERIKTEDQRTTKKSISSTPMMQQYREIKQRFPDAIIFFRMGDFYEMFFEDAKVAHQVLGLTLTKRGKDIGEDVPLAGFPHHQLDNYLAKMTSAGYKVAVVDQLEDPRYAKGVVKRGVTQVATAGTVVLNQLSDERESRYLCAIAIENERCGIAYLESMSGEFFAYEVPIHLLENEIAKYLPTEIIYPKDKKDRFRTVFQQFQKVVFTPIDDWNIDPIVGKEILLNHFQTVSLKGFGLENLPLAIAAAGASLQYLKSSQLGTAEQVISIRQGHPEDTLLMSRSTIHHLELIYPIDFQSGISLFKLLDECSTPMGSRLLRKRIIAPSVNLSEIKSRLDRIETVYDEVLNQKIAEILKQIGDLPRASGRIAANRGNPKDAGVIRDALKVVPQLFQLISDNPSFHFLRTIDCCKNLCASLENALTEKLPMNVSEGGVFKAGFHQELDRLRALAGRGKDALKDFQQRERLRTGIEKLVVGYNRVYGYYIEISRSASSLVPPDYHRIQSLVNFERYKTEELQKFENEVLHAEDKAIGLEIELFQQIRKLIAVEHSKLIQISEAIAEIDVATTLASISKKRKYTKPRFVDKPNLMLRNARHPVLEAIQPAGEIFVPNDVCFNDTKRLLLITGPNMAGKSTYLRTVGLNVILAQMGSFIPAEDSEIGIVDRLFTRIGASDNLTSGESTFLVEMNEASFLINNATSRSLVLLDEVGRGTSTFDGLSIAWAMVERLATTPIPQPRTLFATHYHELTILEEYFPSIENWNVAVKETSDSILFLRKIRKGSCDKSYGIHVAKMAGMPKDIVSRAEVVLELLQTGTLAPQSAARLAVKHHKKVETYQLSLFELEDVSLRKELSNIEPEELTPIQALQIIADWKRRYTQSNKQENK
ncbi:MAG: DNA mismatch repair protein MutS [bacterium]|nr:DNA mismatch repair protein MutS [bacterium]